MNAATPPPSPARKFVQEIGAPDLADFTAAAETAIAKVDSLISEYTDEIDKLKALRRHMAECIAFDRTPGATGMKAATESANRGLNEPDETPARTVPRQTISRGAGQ